MSEISGRRILIVQQRTWAKRLGRTIARKLHAEGARLAALTLKPKTHLFITTQTEVPYEAIYSIDEMREDPEGFLEGDRYDFEEICEALEVDSIWPYVVALRNHARSYSEKFFYSYRQNVSDEQIELYIQAIYKMIVRMCDEFDPELIITPNFVSLPHIMLNLYARKRGIETMATTDAKVRGYSLFVGSFNADTGRFFDRLKELESGVVSENEDRARAYIKEFRDTHLVPTHLEQFLKKEKMGFGEWLKAEWEPWYLVIGWYVKYFVPKKKIRRDMDRVKSLGPTIDWRPPRYVLREHFLRKRYVKKTNAFPYYPFEKLGRFVYLPLQYQPESNIDVCAPFFSNQIETARQVAMSLPDSYTLVVKDHPAMVGYRSPSYLEKLARTPNVKLIDYRVPTAEIFKRTDLVVAPSGTAPAEAAFYNKSVIQLGNLGTTLVLPNVRRHSDMTTLSGVIKEALVTDLHTKEYEEALVRYVAATYDTGFDFNHLGSWQYGKKVDLTPLWEAYKKEILYYLS